MKELFLDFRRLLLSCKSLFILLILGISLTMAGRELHTAALNAFKEKNLSVHDSAVITGLDAFSQFTYVLGSWISLLTILLLIIYSIFMDISNKKSKNEELKITGNLSASKMSNQNIIDKMYAFYEKHTLVINIIFLSSFMLAYAYDVHTWVDAYVKSLDTH